jgi:hypothetical protein
MKKIFSMLVIVLGTITSNAQTPPVISCSLFFCSPSNFKVYFYYTSDVWPDVYAVHDTVPTFDSPYMAKTAPVNIPPGINSPDYLTLDVLLGRPAAVGKTNYARVFISNPAGKDSTCVMFCSSPTDVAESQAEKFSVKICPNPMISNSEIICSKNIEGNFLLYDAMGRLIKNAEIISGRGIVNANGLTQGFYAYQLKDSQGEIRNIGRLSVVK